MKTLTQEMQASMTSDCAIKVLKEGNQRFVSNLSLNRNLLQQVNETADGQYPFATILSCIDSRTTAELIFDQGLGDIFSIRIAGNIVNEDILGSMEFACKVAGSKLIMVLGHTNCGAIKGACDHVEMGNLTTLLEKIQPAIELEKSGKGNSDSNNLDFVNSVARKNIFHSMEEIKSRSTVLRQMIEQGSIALVGGLYDVNTGNVDFFDSE